MGLYGTESIVSLEEAANSNTILEHFFVDDILRMSSKQIHEFCESAEAQILQEKQVLRKPTMMRLSKADDERRRTKIIAYQLAKDANDPLWAKLKKYTKLRKECIAGIMKKYGNKATKMAKIAQKNYIKTASKVSDKAKEK